MTRQMLTKASWVAVLCTGVVLGTQSRVRAQGGEYLTQALGRAVTATQDLQNGTSLGLESGGKPAVMGGWMDQGESVSIRRDLEVGVRYVFIAGGDDDAIDVDLEILDASGNRLVHDTATDSIAIVEFRPYSTEPYEIRTTLYRSNGPSVVVCAVMQDGGYTIPLHDFEAATAKLIVSATESRVDRLVHQPNQWSFYGVIVRGGEVATIRNVRLGEGPRNVLAVGDTDVEDIDLCVTDAYDNVLARDEHADAFPHVRWGASNRAHTVYLKNASTNDVPTLVLIGMYSDDRPVINYSRPFVETANR